MIEPRPRITETVVTEADVAARGRQLAAVAVEALTGDGHAGAKYVLTGKPVLDFDVWAADHAAAFR